MIKRFPTKCTLCGHANTLRVTLGINIEQKHTFECQGCGQTGSIVLEIDFKNRETYDIPGLGKVTYPTVKNVRLENADFSDEEGTITNLDPTFLVPEDQLHVDRIFPWMNAMEHAVQREMEPREIDRRHMVDIVDATGMPRGIREGIAAVIKAVELSTRGRQDLAERKLADLAEICGIAIRGIPMGISVIASAIISKAGAADVEQIYGQAKRAFELNPAQFQDMRAKLITELIPDFLERQLVVLKDYQRAYDQLGQAWVYAAREIACDEQLQPSGRDLDSIRHFYGTAFEHLASGLTLPACINNILSGRNYDQFENMDLRKYLTTDKAGRARCIEGRIEFSPLWNEFNSTIRNGSHHQGLRLKQGSKYVIQYRTGDSKVWSEISYSEYLIRCNRIQICLMKLLMLQLSVLGAQQFEER